MAYADKQLPVLKGVPDPKYNHADNAEAQILKRALQ